MCDARVELATEGGRVEGEGGDCGTFPPRKRTNEPSGPTTTANQNETIFAAALGPASALGPGDRLYSIREELVLNLVD